MIFFFCSQNVLHCWICGGGGGGWGGWDDVKALLPIFIEYRIHSIL